MLNFGIISVMNKKKLLSIITITLLILNLNLAAEGFSVKLRGKLALAGILSGVAFLTYSLVQHDKNVTETLLSQLGRPDYIVKIDRGFDSWYVHQYKNRSYHFLNNRFIRKMPKSSFRELLPRDRLGSNISFVHNVIEYDSPHISLTDKTSLVNPKWLSFSLSHQQRVPSICLSLSLSVGKRTFAAPGSVALSFEVTKTASNFVASSRTPIRKVVSPTLSNSHTLSKVPSSNQ